MKRIYSVISVILLSLSFLISCSLDDNIIDSGELGYIQISNINLDKNVKVSTRSEEDIVSIQIINSKGTVVKESVDWKQLSNQPITLEVGTYIVKAFTPKKEKEQGIDAGPIYKGETTVNIVKGKVKSIDIVCRLSQSMVTVEYSDRFKSAFSNYSVKVGNELGKFIMQEKTASYFLAEKELTAELVLTNKQGRTFTDIKVLSTKSRAGVHYKLKYDISNNGSSGIDVVVDSSMNQYEVDVTISVDEEAKENIQSLEVTNIWAKLAELRANFANSKNEAVVFEYKKSGEEWQRIDATKKSDGVYTAIIKNLIPKTSYTYRAKAGDNISNEVSFITDNAEPLYNGNFDLWSRSDGIWYAGSQQEADSRNSFWDSGNVGTSTLSKYPTYEETTDVRTSGGKAARLQSQFVGLFGFGKFAAGNIYTGHFVKTIGTSGAELQFGVPFSYRPSKLKGWYKYKSGSVDYNGTLPNGTVISKGSQDKCAIYIALSDSPTPYTINTSQKKFVDFKTDPNVIAYAELPESKVNTTDKWSEFTLDLNYISFTRKPRYLVIVASASRYGDYFIGSTGSLMLLDDFEFVYDSNPVITK